jgi:hypothetical protein
METYKSLQALGSHTKGEKWTTFIFIKTKFMLLITNFFKKSMIESMSHL